MGQENNTRTNLNNRDVISVTHSRRGLLTLNKLESLKDVTAKHGSPRNLVIFPFPGVTVAKYLYTLSNGLSRERQRMVIESFNSYGTGIDFLTTPADNIPSTSETFRKTINAIVQSTGRSGVINGKQFAGISENSNLATHLITWNANVASILLKEEGVNTTIIPQPLDVTVENCHSTAYQPRDWENIGDAVLPDNYTRQLTERLSGLINNNLLNSYETGDQLEFERTSRQITGIIGSAIDSGHWLQVKQSLGFDIDSLIKQSRRRFETFIDEALSSRNVGKTDVWRLYGEDISHYLLSATLLDISEPAKVLLSIDSRNRRHETPDTRHLPNGKPVYRRYPAEGVLSYMIKSARERNLPIIMQDLSNRPDTLSLALSKANISIGELNIIQARPESSFKGIDYSLLADI